MKKFLFINTLSMCLGAHLLAAYPVPAQPTRTAVRANNAKPTLAKQAMKKHHSSSSSCSHDRKAVCCKSEKRHPVYASAVANGSANQQFVAPGAPIIFNTVLNISSSVFYNTTTGVFTVIEPGTYEIVYGARFTGNVCISTVVGHNQCNCCTDTTPGVCLPAPDTAQYDPCASMALQINGTEVTGSQVNSDDSLEQGEFGADWVSVAVIQTVNAGTTIAVTAAVADLYGIQLVNDNDCTSCANGDTTAFVTIKKL